MKNTILLITILFTVINYGQTQKAKLYLRDGTILIGFAKIKDDGIVKFNKNINGKKSEKHNYKTLKSLDIVEKDDQEATYKYKIVPDFGPILLKIISEGDSQLCLYSYPIKMKNSSGYWSGGMYFATGGNSEFIVNRYYISYDKSDNIVLKLWSDTYGKGNKYFRKTVPPFFKDCQSLVDKINNETFGMNDIDKIVNFYNQNCNDKN